MTKEEALRENQMSKALHNENIIKELENIKAEIDTLYGWYNQYFKERLVIKSDVMQILNNHISELKGETE